MAKVQIVKQVLQDIHAHEIHPEHNRNAMDGSFLKIIIQKYFSNPYQYLLIYF